MWSRLGIGAAVGTLCWKLPADSVEIGIPHFWKKNPPSMAASMVGFWYALFYKCLGLEFARFEWKHRGIVEIDGENTGSLGRKNVLA